MSIDYKILFKSNIPEEFRESLGEFVSTTESESEKYIFTHQEDAGNLKFKKINWNEVKVPPVAYIHPRIVKSEVAQLIIRRAAGNIGGLNIDDLKDDLIEKSFTVKVLNEYSIGHISDVILNFALEREVKSSSIRTYLVNLLGFLADFKKAGVLSFPIDLDCGFSEDTFFIQAHCKDEGFSFDNILDCLNDDDVESYKAKFKDFVKYTDLTDIFKIDSTGRLVITSCWFYDGVWDSGVREYGSLIIHDLVHLKADREDMDNSVNSFIKQSLDNVSKLRTLDSVLPAKYLAEEAGKIKEAINPLKVKNIYDFLRQRISVPVQEGFSLADLEVVLKDNPRPEGSAKLNKPEKEELISFLVKGANIDDLNDDIQKVKGQITSEDYVNQMIKNLSGMSAQDVKQIIKGKKEDLGDSITRVKGSSEKDQEFKTIVSGSQIESQSNVLELKKLSQDDGSVEVSDEVNTDQEEIKRRVIESNEEDNSVWEVKKLNVVKKMQDELIHVKDLSQFEVNQKIEQIISSELDVEEDESRIVVSQFSDNAAESWLETGVESLNNEIRSRLKLEKIEQQLETRERQVDKMKELITKLKIENGNLNGKLRDLEKDHKALEFHMKNTPSEVRESSMESEDKTTQVLVQHPTEVIELKNENEKLISQIESLKKRVNFMYENSKANAGTNIDTNDIQSMASENTRMKKVIAEHRAEVDILKTEKREAEVLVEKSKRELEEKNEALLKLSQESDGTVAKALENENRVLKEEIISLNQQNKESILKAKSFEQKLKYVNAQIDRYKEQEKKKSQIQTTSTVIDAKTKNQIQKLEINQDKMKKAYSKTQKDLSDKKTELHKATLENKTLTVKVRELEKKLEVLTRKAS